jgi:meso-butanediol dehydrogenase/(S,S)-butanediol dehydrogenase/diacetyl reductase
MGRLDGKIAFITGTANGQGRAAARLFAREGAMIVGCDVKAAESTETLRLVTEAGGKMISTSSVDLGNPDEARRWIDAGVEKTGGIDILYNNAGAAQFETIEKMSASAWDFTLRNEIDLIFYATQAAWPHLLVRGGGVILNTASTVTRRGSSAMGVGAHIAAKAAVVAFTRQTAAEGAAHRIRANSISPGAIESPATAHLRDRAKELSAAIPLGRWGQPEDVAYCALYLASDEARWVTAADFAIDGGATGAR